MHDFEGRSQYGSLKNAEEVAALQNDLRPLLLRRVKEDVEKSIPIKTETVIFVEMTTLQKKLYRAVYEKVCVFRSTLAYGMSFVCRTGTSWLGVYPCRFLICATSKWNFASVAITHTC